MTPEKVRIIRAIYNERMKKLPDDENKIARRKKVTQLIKDAQNNIAKSLKTKTTVKEVTKKLFL